MELLGAEESDEELDDGALSGSGDDYDGQLFCIYLSSGWPLTSYGSELYQDDGYNRSSSTTLCRCSTRDSLLTALEYGSPAPTGAGTDGARQFQGGNSGAHGLTAASHRAARALERTVVGAINSAPHAPCGIISRAL
ncbi:hypothetical protein K438DRAFT_1768667 [Mycena galopus ATCC 62051]|nr:hypothetical protein K438DRAFT_1768667 [Mycena galopus ATCC 62051]